MPDLRSLQEVNGYLTRCGWCPFPLAHEPRKECQSKEGVAKAEESDWQYDWLKWKAQKDLHDAFPAAHASWVTAHNAWEAAHAEWATKHAAWLAWDRGCRVGEEPENPAEPAEPEEPVDPGDPGDEPEKPEGYDSENHAAWVPLQQPPGEPTDEMPELYRVFQQFSTDRKWGTMGSFYSGSGSYPQSGETKTEWTWEWTLGIGLDPANTATQTRVSNLWRPWLTPPGTSTTTTETTSGSDYAFLFLPISVPFEAEAPVETCTATEYRTTIHSIAVWGEEQDVLGLPDPPPANPYDFSFPNLPYKEWGNMQRDETTMHVQLSSPLTKPELLTKARGRVAATWPEKPAGSACHAALECDWPLIGDFLSGRDPAADPPVPGRWLSCEDAGIPVVTQAEATATDSRYKWGIPAEDSRELWLAAHAEWELACPTTRGPEPKEPTIPFYQLRWDDAFFPKVWDVWDAAHQAYTEAVAAHEAWEAADPETRGPEPVIPADPGEEPEDKPQLIAHRTWDWSPGSPEWSDWFENAAPAAEGEIRQINAMAIQRHTKYGMKGTQLAGETYEWP